MDNLLFSAYPILFTGEEIARRVKTLAREIDDRYGHVCNSPLVIVGVLDGAFVFVADLVRHLCTPVEVTFVGISSYGPGMEPSDVTRITKALEMDVEERHVLLVEDIMDTGQTVKFLYDQLQPYKPRSIKTCALLDKPSRRTGFPITPDFIGFPVPDKFVVGYGMDYAGLLRNSPHIHTVLQREDSNHE